MTFLISFALLVIPYILFLFIYGFAEGIYSSIYYSSGVYTSYPNLNLGLLPMIMLVNPISGFFDYMMQTMDITSVHEMISASSDFGTVMPILAYGWIPMNVIVSGAISYFFIRMAARKLNPIRKQKKKRKAAVPVVAGTPMPTQPVMAEPTMPTQPVVADPQTEKLIGGTNVR
jgi:hypothetical protein